MLKKSILTNYKIARKEKDEITKEVLWIIISNIKNKEIELRPQNKEITNDDIIKIIQKEIKQIDEEIELFKKSNELKIPVLEIQKDYLNSFLPKKLSKDKLEEIIKTFIKENNIDVSWSWKWKLFKFLKENYNNLYDWQLVNEIINKL